MPVLIGAKMAKSNGLKEGDTSVVRWRNAASAYVADEIEVAVAMSVENFCIDEGQLGIPLEVLPQRL